LLACGTLKYRIKVKSTQTVLTMKTKNLLLKVLFLMIKKLLIWLS